MCADSSSIHSDEDTYDELDKPRSTYNTLRSVQPGGPLYGPVANLTPASPNGTFVASYVLDSPFFWTWLNAAHC